MGPFDYAKSVEYDSAARKYDHDHGRKRGHKLARDRVNSQKRTYDPLKGGTDPEMARHHQRIILPSLDSYTLREFRRTKQ